MRFSAPMTIVSADERDAPNPARVAGGRAARAKVSPERRSEIAAMGGRARRKPDLPPVTDADLYADLRPFMPDLEMVIAAARRWHEHELRALRPTGAAVLAIGLERAEKMLRRVNRGRPQLDVP